MIYHDKDSNPYPEGTQLFSYYPVGPIVRGFDEDENPEYVYDENGNIIQCEEVS